MMEKKKELLQFESDLRRCSQLLFWRFQYKKRAALMNLTNSVGIDSCIDLIVDILSWEDNELEKDTHRHVASAIIRSNCGIKPSYDLSKVPPSILEKYELYAKLSAQYGYYPIDIVSLCSPIELIRFFNQDKKTPSPPLRPPMPCLFLGNIDEISAILRITAYLHSMEYYPTLGEKDEPPMDKEDLKRLEENLLLEMGKSITNTSENGMNSDTAKIIYQSANNFQPGQPVVSEEDLKAFLEIYKKASKSSFQIKSSLSRAVGIYLWDCVNVYGMAQIDAIELIQGGQNYSNGLCKDIDMIVNNNEKAFNRLYRGAEKCINNGKVLPVNG